MCYVLNFFVEDELTKQQNNQDLFPEKYVPKAELKFEIYFNIKIPNQYRHMQLLVPPNVNKNSHKKITKALQMKLLQ